MDTAVCEPVGLVVLVVGGMVEVSVVEDVVRVEVDDLDGVGAIR